MSEIIGPLNTLVGVPYNYSLDPPEAGIYTWYIGNAEIIAGQGTPNITVIFNLPGQNQIKLDVEHGVVDIFVIVISTT
jgi:hypothetical protein